jgi:hypothetical protein
MEVGFILSIGLSIQASLVIGAGVLSIKTKLEECANVSVSVSVSASVSVRV